MSIFPLSELLQGTKRFFVGLQGKKSDGVTMETLKTNDSGALKVSSEIIGSRALSGESGLSVSYVLDNDGIPVLRVVPAAMPSYIEDEDALRIKPIIQSNTILGESLGITVEGGANLTLFGTLAYSDYLIGYTKYYLQARTNTTHSFKIETYAQFSEFTIGGQGSTWVELINESINMKTIAPKDVLGVRQIFRLTNNDTVSHTYDVVLFGI